MLLYIIKLITTSKQNLFTKISFMMTRCICFRKLMSCKTCNDLGNFIDHKFTSCQTRLFHAYLKNPSMCCDNVISIKLLIQINECLC